MGLSTHVLDTMHGTPASGMAVTLYRGLDAGYTRIARLVLNDDGRPPQGMLIPHDELQVGTYRLEFAVADYFKACGVRLPEPNFLTTVHLDFGVAHVDQHYHVPLLVSPWSYSTYRGS